MTAVPLLGPDRRIPLLVRRSDWECAACGATDTTFDPRVHSRFHACGKLGGLSIPMVPAGTRANVEVHDREDYAGTDLVQRIPETGRVVMSVTVTRDDGQDCAVYAPTATASG